MADPGVMSASKITTYRGCPLSYYFNYVAHLDVPQAPAKVLGAEIHIMLRKFYRKNPNKKGPYAFASVDNFLGAWKHRWFVGVVKNKFGKYKEIAWRSKEQQGSLYVAGLKILKSFYEKNITLPAPIAVEKRFDVQLKEHKIRGVYDRIDIRDGQHFITDYKTDRFSPEQNPFVLHRHPQFTIYSFAYEKLNKTRPVIAFLHLRSGKAFETRRSEEDYNYLEELLDSTTKAIREDNFTPFYGFHCNLCEYVPVCKKVCIDVGSKLKKLEEKGNLGAKKVEWLSYEVEQPSGPFQRILDRIPSDLQKFLIEKFEYALSLEERVRAGEAEAVRIAKERKEAQTWKIFTEPERD